MKKTILEFIRRGLTACGLGPVVLVSIYLVLQQKFNLRVLTVNEVCLGIVSASALAFLAGGTNVIYQIERLPLSLAILIHGTVLYFSYLVTYLLNGWLAQGIQPVLIFTVIFVLGYVVIWIAIYSITRRKTRRLNENLKRKQQCTAKSIDD